MLRPDNRRSGLPRSPALARGIAQTSAWSLGDVDRLVHMQVQFFVPTRQPSPAMTTHARPALVPLQGKSAAPGCAWTPNLTLESLLQARVLIPDPRPGEPQDASPFAGEFVGARAPPALEPPGCVPCRLTSTAIARLHTTTDPSAQGQSPGRFRRMSHPWLSCGQVSAPHRLLPSPVPRAVHHEMASLSPGRARRHGRGTDGH